MKHIYFNILSILLLTCYSTQASAVDRKIASVPTSELEKAESARLKPSNVKVILNNNESFLSKLDLINKATTSIRMSYFIFADDESTSLLSEALIKKANKGVKVKIIVDYFSNYSRLDYFSMLEREGRGNISVRFYNRPTRNIIRDAVYLTTPCPYDIAQKKCWEHKSARVNAAFKKPNTNWTMHAMASNAGTEYSKMFLSGLYGKNPKLMAKAILSGQQIDLAKLQSGDSKMTAEDKKNLKELLHIYFLSKFGSPAERAFNKIKLYMAAIFHSDTVPGVLNSVNSLLPVKLSKKYLSKADRKLAKYRNSDWSFLTDYTHHKLLLVDNKYIQLGGRNLENSYHMDPNPLTDKYIFVDTDVRAEIMPGGGASKIAKTFDELYNYKRLLASIKDIRQHAPNELLANSNLYEKAEKSCPQNLGKKLELCIKKKFAALYMKEGQLGQRMDRAKNKLQVNAKKAYKYYSKFTPKGGRGYYQAAPGNYQGDKAQLLEVSFDLSGQDMIMSYLENLPYDRKSIEGSGGMVAYPWSRKVPAHRRLRKYGAIDDEELKYGKNIHHMLSKGPKAVCESSANKREYKRIVLHNAYVLLPAKMLEELRKMIDGTYDCRYVKVQFLSNSQETTDLDVVNLFSNHTMRVFFQFYKERKNAASATFEYYEYKRLTQDDSQNLSLHTKLYLMGDDVFIGSANLDPRSYMMDTNNGFYFKNVSGFVSSYLKYFDSVIGNREFTRDITRHYMELTPAELARSDKKFLDDKIIKYKADKWIKANKKEAEVASMKKDLLDLLQLSESYAAKILYGDNYRNSNSPSFGGKKYLEKYNSMLKAI
ncbi:MAG: hypothetical protein ISR65_08265 [Bacteriovoracaceae bacterium]|nr:hypothetical protein [Bacteriovoracaceae bacterium]